MACSAKQVKNTANGFVSIFDGKSLKKWEGDTTYWSVMDGALTGEVKAENLLRNNSFIIWR